MGSYSRNPAFVFILPLLDSSSKSAAVYGRFNVPIVNWGRRQAARKTSETIQQLTEYTNAMDAANFNQEITTLYNNIFLLRKNIALAITTQAITNRCFNKDSIISMI